MAAVDGIRLAYVIAFGVGTIACIAGLARARRIEHRETRVGLTALLAGSGLWTASHLGLFLLPRGLKGGAYLVGLIFGFSTVWAWLYFCSAYTGRSYHRDPRVRTASVAVFLAVVSLKVTNPIHGLYFTATYVAEPFPHLAIRQGAFHWAVTGLSYALAAIGLFMLFEQFAAADYDTTAVGALVALTGLPVVLDVAGYVTPVLLDVIHAPLGVAVFALGALYAFEDRFLAVQLTGDVDDAVVFLDDDDRIRDFNGRAREILPELAGARGDPATTVPDLGAALSGEDEVIERSDGEATEYYLCSTSSFALGQSEIGRVIVLTDVTRIERQRRELRRHNEQLENLGEGMRHELRNALQIVDGHVTAAGAALDRGDVDAARESLGTAGDSADRMESLIDDFAMVTRYGQSVEETADVDVERAVEAAWDDVTSEEVTLDLRGGGTVVADPDRLEVLFRNAFQLLARSAESAVTVRPREDGVALADDGDDLSGADPDRLLSYGEAAPTAETGMLLPNVRALARVHGWTVDVETDGDAGLRLVVSGMTVREFAPAGESAGVASTADDVAGTVD